MKTGAVSLSPGVFADACVRIRDAARAAAETLPADGNVVPLTAVRVRPEGALWGVAAPAAARLLSHCACAPDVTADTAGVDVIDMLTRHGLETGTLPWRLAMSSLVGVPRARAAGVLSGSDVDGFIVDAAVLGIDGAISARRMV